MTRGMRAIVVLVAATVVGGLAELGPGEGFISVAEAKPKKKDDKGPAKGKNDLQNAYDALTDASSWTGGGRARPPRDLARLSDLTKDIYRDAVHAAREDDPRRADELAKAAHDAARGLVHALRADAPVVRGIPAPPLRNSNELDDLLRRTRDRLQDADTLESCAAGRAFLDAARHLYDQARQADRDDPIRAMQLARASEAWTHVGEHLSRAESDRDALPPPERRRERPAPPDDRRRPRPPDDRRGPPPPPPE